MQTVKLKGDRTTLMSLPPIRTSVEAAKRDLDDYGLTRFAGALSGEALAELQNRLIDQAKGEEAQGMRWSEGPNQRVWTLINKGRPFRDLATNPILLELISHLLTPDFLLYSYTANIAHKGGKQMALHSDQDFRGLDYFPYSFLANSILMLVDFTEENGATDVVPGSHLFGRRPAPSEPRRATPAIGPAGTLLVFDGRLWHGTGANRTDEPRYGILAAYCRPFLRQQENYPLAIAPEVLTQCSEQLRTLLGFQTWTGGGALGMINGSPPGTINERPTTFVTELAP